jgi:thiol-disulfide isomerase/thioredoxin
MSRPFRVWGVAVVGLGILVGCAKKPTETVSGTADPTPEDRGAAPGPAGPGRGEPRGPANAGAPTEPAAQKGGADWTIDLGAALAKMKVEPAAPPAEAPAPPAGERAAAGGTVEVAQVRFDGVEKALAAARGKVVLIDCWATWCGPCVASFPKLVEKHQKYATNGLAVISLSTDRVADAGKVVAFLKKHNATFTNLHLPLDAAAQKGLVDKFAYRNAIPHAALFGRTGDRVWVGHPMDPKLTTQIEAELAKGGPSFGG